MIASSHQEPPPVSGKERQGETPRRKSKFRFLVYAMLALGVAMFLCGGGSEDHPAPFPLITGKSGPLPYDQNGEPGVFVGSRDEYDAFRQVYWPPLGDGPKPVEAKPATAKEDENRVSEYRHLIFKRRDQSNDALEQVDSKLQNLENQLHRSRLNPWRLWHTGLMGDERIVQEMARVLKDQRAHEIIIRLAGDLANAIDSGYLGKNPLPTDPNQDANRFPSYY